MLRTVYGKHTLVFSIFSADTRCQMFASARVEASTQNIRDVATRIDTTATRIEGRMLTLEQLQSVGLETKRQISFIDASCISPRSSGSMPNFTAVNLWERGAHVADGYLCSEVEEIDRILQGLSTSQATYAGTQDPYLRPFKPIIHFKPQANNKISYRRETISMAIDILRTLQNVPACGLSFQQGAWNLVNLSIGLYYLELYPEAAVIGLWAVKLFRVLVVGDQNTYRPYLVISLHNLAQYHIAQKNDKDAPVTLSECLDISRILVRESPTPEFVGFLSRSLTESSKLAAANQEYTRSLQESQEAVKVFEDFFFSSRAKHIDFISELDASQFIGTRQCLTRRKDDEMEILDGPNDTAIFSDESTKIQRIHEYSRALHQLSYNLHHHGRFLEAIDADKKALQLIHFSSQKNEIPIDTDIAEVLFHLCHPDFRLFIPIEDAIRYIREAVEIYQRFADDGSIVYCRLLYHSFYIQATILRSIQDYTEEFKVWSQAAKVARSINEELLCANALYQICWSLRQLDRLDDAVNMRLDVIKIYCSVLDSPSEIVANAHYELAVDLQLANRNKESRVAAQEAIRQYRILVLRDYEMSAEALADSMALLISILLSTYDVNEALDIGEEALRLYRSIISHNPLEDDIISRYIHCLDINIVAAFQSDDERKAIKRGLFVVELLEELLPLSPENDSSALIDCWRDYGLLLNRYGRLQEARHWVEKAIEWSGSHKITASHEIERLIVCLRAHALILDGQGFRDDALKSIAKAVQLAEDAVLFDSSLATVYVASRVCQVDVLWELGRYCEALSTSEETTAFARRSRLDGVQDLIDCLLMHATVLNCNNQPERSIDLTNEVVELCHSNSSALGKEDSAIHLSHALHTLSESFADLGRHDESLSHAQRSMNQLVEFQSTISSIRRSHFRYRFMMSSINLAERLATVGNYEKAIQLLSEARSFFEEFSFSRNGYYIELSRVLRLIGLLHCSFGRHEEGAAVAANLASLRKRLSILFPSIASLIDKEFERTTCQPSWWRISDMALTSNCSCLRICSRALSVPSRVSKGLPAIVDCEE